MPSLDDGNRHWVDGLKYYFSPFALETLNFTPEDVEQLISYSYDLIVDKDSFDLL